MKRLVPLAAGAILLALTMPTSTFGQTPAGDSVTGGAHDCVQVVNGFCEDHSVGLDAHSGPDGENPTGTMSYGFGFGSPGSTGFGQGQVTCLSVAGNVATIGFTGREFDEFLELFVSGWVTVKDGGGPGSGLDRFNVLFLKRDLNPVPTPANCDVAPDALPFANDDGDLTVVDATPRPKTYSQCRQAGWVKYGFASHADCIDYVHDRARQACIFERVAHGITAFRAKYGLGPTDDHAMRHCVRLYTGF